MRIFRILNASQKVIFHLFMFNFLSCSNPKLFRYSTNPLKLRSTTNGHENKSYKSFPKRNIFYYTKVFFSAFLLQVFSSWDAFINMKLIPVLVCRRCFFLCRVWRNYWIILENHSNHFERTCHCSPHLLTIFSVFWELLGLSVRRFYSTHATIWLGFCGFGW